MKERVLDFKVHLPQLEVAPGRFKGGVKRYGLQKNEDSPGLLVGGSILSSIKLSNSGNSSILNSHIERPFNKHNQSISLPPITYQRKQNKTPKKFTLNDSTQQMLELLSHPAFRQPKYTKQNPKITQNNPIIGYSPMKPYSIPFGKLKNSLSNKEKYFERNMF